MDILVKMHNRHIAMCARFSSSADIQTLGQLNKGCIVHLRTP